MISPDSALLARLERIIRRQRLFKPHDTIIVALSGGADSTALLDLLSRLPVYNLRLVAGHLNHCLRGGESDADEEFCRQLAANYSIPFESRRVDVRALAESEHLNLEDAGRRARIAFLGNLRKKHCALAVAMAHHADDQAETVLMRLLRGSGMSGLSGMAYRNERGYIRPLLDVPRSTIEQYLRGRGINWREDTSNFDKAYLRNRIRHELLPLLEDYNPAIRLSLAATASVLSADEILLRELTEQVFTKSCRMEEGRIVCVVGQLQALSLALRRRVLRHAFKQLTGSLEGVALRHIYAICDMIDSPRPNSRLALPQQVSAVREYDRLLFQRTAETVHEPSAEILITATGHYLLPDGDSLEIEISGSPVDFSAISANRVFVDLNRNPFPWLVRPFRPGDRMIPFGMTGRKKVKDIFIDRKVPLTERRRIPLLFCGDDLIWIAGVCVSELCRIEGRSDVMVKVRWHLGEVAPSKTM